MINQYGMEVCGTGTINLLTPSQRANLLNGNCYINISAYDRDGGNGVSDYVQPEKRHAPWLTGQCYNESKELANIPKKKQTGGAKWGKFIEQKWKEKQYERSIKTY